LKALCDILTEIKTGGTSLADIKNMTEKQKSLEVAIASIEKQFGKGAVMRLGSSRHLQVDSIPTGSLALDHALGVGGVPRGRVIEIFGPESSGKTTLTLHIVAQAQKMGGQAAFIDVEHALDPVYARKLGVDTENLLIAQPNSGEEALEITEMLVRSNAVDCIVLDSVAALTSRSEIDGDMGDASVGLQARLMSQAMRKLTPVVSKSRASCIFINQIREKIGVMFGNPETTPGGRALKFFSSVRLDIRRKEQIKDGDEVKGYVTEVKVVKNKVAPPFRKARFDLMFGSGISTEGEVLEIADSANIINRAGAWYSYGDIRMGQGRENSKQFLRDNPDIFAEIVLKVKKSLGMIGESEKATEQTEKNQEEKKKSLKK
jgi:recombination protein RecA